MWWINKKTNKQTYFENINFNNKKKPKKKKMSGQNV